MKTNIFIFAYTIRLLLGEIVSAHINIPQADKQQISDNLDSLVEAINIGDIQKVTSLVSPKNPVLQSDIQEIIGGIISYQLDYTPFDKNVEVLNINHVKIKGNFVASVTGWNITGLTYLVFEKQSNQQWLLIDTDFHKKLAFKNVFIYVASIWLGSFAFWLVSFAFWLWMLIDCVKREFDDKALWIILLIFLNFIAAILYYFLVKRKNVTRKPLEFKI